MTMPRDVATAAHEGVWVGFGPTPGRLWVRTRQGAPALPDGVRWTRGSVEPIVRAPALVQRLLARARVLRITVPPDLVLPGPIVLDRATLGRSVVVVRIGRGARVAVSELIEGDALGAIVVRLGEGAQLTWRTSVRLRARSLAVLARQVVAGAGGQAALDLDLVGAGRLSLTDTVRLTGVGARADAGARVQLDGDGRLAHDVRQVVDAARCTTRFTARAVLAGASRSTFRGVLRQGRRAQGADSQQSHRALLLSDRAVNDATPALEILADAVRCSHSATTARLDDQMRFYLQSRGIPSVDADALLTEAFLAGAQLQPLTPSPDAA